jgi:hypothetical protein
MKIEFFRRKRMESSQRLPKKINWKVISAIIAAIAATIGSIILVITFILDHCTGSKFEAPSIYPISIGEGISAGTTIIYPDNGSWTDNPNERFLYGFASNLSLKNTSNQTISIKKITIHVEDIKQNESPYIVGWMEPYSVGDEINKKLLTLHLQNEGWGQSKDTILTIEIENQDPSGLDAKNLFGWKEKELSVGTINAGQTINLEIIKPEDLNISYLKNKAELITVNVYYNTDEIEKTWLTSGEIEIRANSNDSLEFSDPYLFEDNGGSLPKKYDGEFTSVMTIPTNNIDYSKDYYSDIPSDSSVPEGQYGYFSFIILPEKSCEFDIWFEVTLMDGKVRRASKIKSMKVRVPYFVNPSFLSYDGSDPRTCNLSNLYNTTTVMIEIDD